MAEIEKLVGSESPLEVGQKINKLIENKANTDLSNLSATGENKFNAIVPTGTVISSAASSTPSGYLYCNGSAVSRTTYANLFNAIGTTYGNGDGSTTFNLPNYSTYKFVTSATISVKGNGKPLGLMTSSKNDLYLSKGYQGTVNYPQVGVGSSTSVPALTTNLPVNTASGISDGTLFGVNSDASKSGLTGSVGTATLKWYIKY